MKYDYLDEALNSGHYPEMEIHFILRGKIEETTDECAKHELLLLSNIMGLHYNEANQSCPYEPQLIVSNKRSFSIDDLEEADALFLFNNIESLTQNPIILSKVYEVLWFTKFEKVTHHTVGQNAAKYYHEYLKILMDKKKFFDATDIVKKYVNITLSLGKKSDAKITMLTFIETNIKEPITSENDTFMIRLYNTHLKKLISNLNTTELVDLIVENIERYIDGNTSYQHIFTNQRLTDILVNYANKFHNSSLKERSLLKLKQLYLSEIENESMPIRKVYRLRHAIDCLKKLGAQYNEEIKNLQMSLESAQTEIPNSMQPIQVDLSHGLNEKINYLIEKSEKIISNLDTFDALVTLAKSMRWIRPDEIKEHNYTSLIEQITNIVNYNHKGQEKNTSTYTYSEKKFINMYYELTFFHCTVNPMLNVIRQEQQLLSKDAFIDILSINPLVPEGYEKTYSRGLYYYLTGEYLEAAYILIPAFENSLRHLVSNNHPISYSKSKGVDMNTISIDVLIERLEEDNVISNTIALNLKYFFGSKDCNFRNDLMHGFMPYDYMYSPLLVSALSLIYWFIFYLYCDNQS